MKNEETERLQIIEDGDMVIVNREETMNGLGG